MKSPQPSTVPREIERVGVDADATLRAGEEQSAALAIRSVRTFRVVVTKGPDKGKAANAVDGRMTVGVVSGTGPTLRLSDRTVSRFHVEFEATPAGIVIRDLESTNGTRLGGTLVREVVVRDAVELAVGHTRVRLEPGSEEVVAEPAMPSSFGGLIGSSPAMRAAYAVLKQAAPTSAPVLITGETGTGKELAARALHDASPRANQPFEVVDCGGLPATLIESELFGHERGAFTTAVAAHEGAFERAAGGTLFLDEVGELPLDVQPKLLRALGEGEVRRVGGKHFHRTNVRIVAATNRDLRQAVNSGRFRADLFYRLAVIQVRMPALRDRPGDLPLLVNALLATIAREWEMEINVPVDAALCATLAEHAWPGNVRELRNHLEQLVILQGGLPRLTPLPGMPIGTRASLDGLENLPLRAAKAQLVERFERDYITCLLDQTKGNVAEAARRSGVDRRTLFRAIRRYGLRAAEDEPA